MIQDGDQNSISIIQFTYTFALFTGMKFELQNLPNVAQMVADYMAAGITIQSMDDTVCIEGDIIDIISFMSQLGLVESFDAVKKEVVFKH